MTTSTSGTITTSREFFDHIVTVDLADLRSNPADLRRVWHCASSLFHQADWLITEHRATMITEYSLTPTNNDKKLFAEFAEKLAAMSNEFQLIRGLANAGKHRLLRSELPNPAYQDYQPTASANAVFTSVQVSPGRFEKQAALQGPGGKHRPVLPDAEVVWHIWDDLLTRHGW